MQHRWRCSYRYRLGYLHRESPDPPKPVRPDPYWRCGHMNIQASPKYLGEECLHFDPGQVSAQTEVIPPTEGEMVVWVTIDLERIRLVEAPLVTVGRPEPQDDLVARRNPGFMPFEVTE